MNTSKEELIVLRPESEDVSQEKLYEVIKSFKDNVKEIKRMTDENNSNKELLKTVSLDAYIEEYKLRNENPGSLHIEAVKGNSIEHYMFIPKDQYIQLKNKQHIEDLKEKYGEDIVEKTSSYQFNTVLFEKYRELFEQFIEESFEIDDDDKKQLITETEKFSIKKGTIEQLSNISIDTDEEIEEIFEQIKVVSNIKV